MGETGVGAVAWRRARAPRLGDRPRPRRRGPLSAGRDRRRHHTARQAPLEAGSERGRPARGPAPARVGACLGDERQDDHVRNGRGDSRALRAAGAQPSGREPRFRGGDRARRGTRRRAGPVRGGRGGAARGGDPSLATRGLARKPVPRPARPLRGARAAGRALAPAGPRPPAGSGAGGKRRRPAARRDRHGTARLRRFRPRRPTSRLPRCSTPPTRSGASAAGRRTTMRRPTSAISATTAARPAGTRGLPSTWWDARSS